MQKRKVFLEFYLVYYLVLNAFMQLKLNIFKKRGKFMKLKKVICLMGICVAMSTTAVTAFAADEPHQKEMSVGDENVKQPRVYWKGNARLSTDGYYNVTSSNNIFNDSPKVTNHAGNPGTIRVRIINEAGEKVGRTKDIEAGKTIQMDQIPAFSGRYTLQAKALDSAGTYTITID